MIGSLHPDVDVHAARPADRAGVVAVVRATGLFGPEEAVEVEALLDRFLSGDGGAARWVVVRDGGGAGVAGVAYHAPEPMTAGTRNLYFLAVHPDRQGRGLGAALVRAVERELLEQGVRLLLIETSGVPGFAGQRAFYDRLGYRHEATIRDFYDAGDDKVVYAKALVVEPGRPEPAPGSVTVRAAHTDDLARVLLLAEAFYREDGFATPADRLRANLRVLLRSDAARLAVAEQDGEILGFAITTSTFGLESGLVAELEDLYVDPTGRGRGLGDRLIDDSAAWAREQGATRLEIVTAPNGRDITRLRAYYAARGFVDDGRQLVGRDLSSPEA